MSHYAIAGSGLEKMFYGQILTIFGIIPLIGWIAAIAGMVLFLVGLHEAAGADEGYRAAFYVEIAMLALSVLNLFLGVLGIFTSALSLVTVYLVCSTTSSLLSAKGVLAAAARGQLVWKIYVVCAVVSIICSILLIFRCSMSWDLDCGTQRHRLSGRQHPLYGVPLPSLQKPSY